LDAAIESIKALRNVSTSLPPKAKADFELRIRNVEAKIKQHKQGVDQLYNLRDSEKTELATDQTMIGVNMMIAGHDINKAIEGANELGEAILDAVRSTKTELTETYDHLSVATWILFAVTWALSLATGKAAE
jgi:hypothetical protein